MVFASCRRPVALVLYCGAAVFVNVLVNGQSTTDDDNDQSQIRNLIDMVAKLTAEQAKSAKKIAQLEEHLSAITASKSDESKNEELRHTSYIRWGRKTCEGNATLLYKGSAAGPIVTQGDSGSNFLCLPEDPQWKTYLTGGHTSGTIAGVEYELHNSGTHHNNVFSESNNGGNPLANNPAPCAVCYVQGRSTVLMIPARTQCPDGWITEYTGYLVSEYSADSNRKRSSYICWDGAPEIAAGEYNQNQCVIYPVEVTCGTLPCSVYNNGKELACIVCSK